MPEAGSEERSRCGERAAGAWWDQAIDPGGHRPADRPAEPLEEAMTATAIPTSPSSTSSSAHPIRLVLVAIAVTALLLVAFVLGRVTESSGSDSHSPATRTTPSVQPAEPPAPRACGIPGPPC